MTFVPDWISNDIPDVVMDDAASWMAILDSERCNKGDRAAFAQWLDEDPSHRWAFEELSEVWARLRTLNEVEPLLRQPGIVPFPAAMDSGFAAASKDQAAVQSDWSTLVVALVIGVGVLAHFAFSTPSEEFVTGVGESRDIELSDGSRLELNARTTVAVTISDQRRDIELIGGEAVFHVASDARPFVVNTDYGKVVALGTRFNVEVNTGTLEVSVIEGQVSVMTDGADVPLTVYDARVGHQFSKAASVLGTGEWLEVSGAQQRQQLLGTEEFRKRLSWRNGMIVFENQPLQAVVEEMRRYTATSIHVVDSELGDLRISGEYETGNVVQFLAQLENNYPVVVDDAYDDWILLRPK